MMAAGNDGIRSQLEDILVMEMYRNNVFVSDVQQGSFVSEGIC